MAPKDSWTLEELVRQVATALAAIDPARTAGDPPSARTVRYYTDLGLVDPPSARRGLHAMYGHRHFLQLLSVKRLQARGLPLSEIRAELASASTSRLTGLARPATPISKGDLFEIQSSQHDRLEGEDSEPPARPRSRETRSTEVQAPQNDRLEGDYVEPPPTSPRREARAAEAVSGNLQGFTLPGGVIVLLPGTRSLSEAELQSLRHAAGPLAALAGRILAQHRGAAPDPHLRSE